MSVTTGLERLQGLRDGGPRVGIGALLGMTLEEVEPGRVVFALATRSEFSNPQGTLHGGITATLLDSAMTCAVLSALPAGAGATTVDLSVTFVRPGSLDGAALHATGETLHVGRTVATARGTVTDERDRVLATATSTCLLQGASDA